VRLRPPAREDAEGVLAVVVARDIADIGHPDYSLEDVLADWSTPGIDPQLDCVVAEDDTGELVGYALIDHRGAMVSVHPEAEGRGIGTALRERVEARAAERGDPARQAVAGSNDSGLAHLRAAGYEREHVYQRMTAALQDVPPPVQAPIRPFDLESEGPAVHDLIEEAFSEIEGNVDDPYESWRARVEAKSEPAFRLVLEDAEGIAGAATGERWEGDVGYVGEIGVARRARGRGHGRALLLAMLDAFRQAGLSTGELSVHGRNIAATGLYESAGMRPAFRQERWIKT
jgi:ribosomal protein S18 acetylase RimI-like enzyme